MRWYCDSKWCRMLDKSIKGSKNQRPLRTQQMRDEGWEGRALLVPVSVIFKTGEAPGGRPSKQPIERDLDNAIALMYAGLFTLLQARDRRDHGRPVEPQAIRDISIASSISVSRGLPYCHDHLMTLAKRAIRSDPRFSSLKAFNDAYRSIGARVPADTEARILEETSIAEQFGSSTCSAERPSARGSSAEDGVRRKPTMGGTGRRRAMRNHPRSSVASSSPPGSRSA